MKSEQKFIKHQKVWGDEDGRKIYVAHTPPRSNVFKSGTKMLLI